MTELERLLLESLQRLMSDSEQREQRLLRQLNAVTNRLNVVTQYCQELSNQQQKLSDSLRVLTQELNK